MQTAQPLPSDAPAQRPVKVRIDGISKHYGPVEALQPTTLEILAGEFVTVLGPSGSGKTTLLQIISGLTEPTSGRLFIDGADQTHVPVHRREIGVVFQNYALFPHLTVAENVTFPLQMRRMAAAVRRAKLEAALEMVGLSELRDRFPRELSGGQQQRVALARCFVYAPSLILMDEPLGALDRKLRETMQIEIKRLHRETGATIVFVTHDQEEALELADRVAILNLGQIQQVGTPDQVHDHPANAFVCGFVGEANRFEGKVESGVFTSGPIRLAAPGVADGDATAFIRPYDLAKAPAGEGFELRVSRIVTQGPISRVEGADATGRRIEADFAREEVAGVQAGGTLRLAAKIAHVFAAT